MTAAEFDTLVGDGGAPVLVDFWATWCGPCRALAPILEQVAGELEGRLRVVKVDVDAEPALSARFAVSSVPTLVLLRDGQLVWTSTGAKPKPVLLGELTARL